MIAHCEVRVMKKREGLGGRVGEFGEQPTARQNAMHFRARIKRTNLLSHLVNNSCRLIVFSFQYIAQQCFCNGFS